MTIIESAEQQAKLHRNIDYLKTLSLKIDAVPVTLNTDLKELQRLADDVGLLPYPNVLSEELKSLQHQLRERVGDKQKQLADLARNANWEKFKQIYLALMSNNNPGEAARILVEFVPKNQQHQDLVNDFRQRAPIIITQKVQDHIKLRSYRLAREAAGLSNEPNVVQLLHPNQIARLRDLSHTIDEAEDRDLYSQILKNRPHCLDQINAYLERAPLKVMHREVRKYQEWIIKIKQPLNLTITLSAIYWHDKY
ncbi:MAG: hypothetical protein RML93_07545, partial [Anaerolineales bacterium]|nr:hypothetical protein [Anaerolineales bacterium]MDW8447127.1 hypothetical protein [Anaerolineales bacterium]